MCYENANFTFMSTIVARGDDGSTIRSQDVGHFELNANGEVTVTFEKPSLTCTP
jgi:hypothetical protein